MRRRFLAVLLTFCMILSTASTAFASEADGIGGTAAAETSENETKQGQAEGNAGSDVPGENGNEQSSEADPGSVLGDESEADPGSVLGDESEADPGSVSGNESEADPGSVLEDESEADPGNVSGNEADLEDASDEYCYVVTEVPFDQFYQAAGLENSEGIDAVSSATTSKVANCKNVYLKDGEGEAGGTDILGVKVPVKVLKDSVSANSVETVSSPSVYLEKREDNGYTFFSAQDEKTESDVEAAITSASTWGDYEIDLSDTGKGITPDKVYGVYLTTAKEETGENGETSTIYEKYAMLQSQNLWTPSNYYEVAWSTVSETNRVGCLTNCDYYSPMEGQKVVSMTYITVDGLVTYQFKEALEILPHFDGTVSAYQIDEDKVLITDIPDGVEDVKVTIQASGKGGTVVASEAAPVNGIVTLEEAVEAGKTYNVTVASGNYAAAKTTLSKLGTWAKVYAFLNVPYNEFYQAAGLENSDGIDAVSSATNRAAGNCKNVYFAAEPTIEGGVDISGVIIPVRMGLSEYLEAMEKETDANQSGYVSGAVVKAPAVYLEKAQDGSYTLVVNAANDKTETGVKAALTSSSTWGDYQLNLNDSSKGQDPENVYGVYLTTAKEEAGEDGSVTKTEEKYAMLQSQNLWTPGNYYEMAWSTVSEKNGKGCLTNCGYYEPMEGQEIVSMTFITKEGLVTYELEAEEGALKIQRHFGEEITAVQIASDSVLITGVPDDAENVAVTIKASGKGGAAIADGVSLGDDGVVKLTGTVDAGSTYNVTVAASNYAAAKTTLVLLGADENVYALVNVPYSEFYQAAGLENSDGIDAVSSATNRAAGNCKNVYFAAEPTIEGGIDISGVVVPVQMTAAEYQKAAETVSANAVSANEEGYISGAVTDPKVYLKKDDSGKYQLVDTTDGSAEENIKAELTSASTWGDYQLNLSDTAQGKAPEDVYGVYITLDSGEKYAMLQSQNLWTPGNYYEMAWSTVSEENAKGCLTNRGYYQPMEGQKIISMTWITKDGVVAYEFESAMDVLVHFDAKITAVQIEARKIFVTGFPADAKDVTVTVQASGRGGAVVANGVSLADGVAELEDDLETGKTYNVTLSSGNYASVKTTLVLMAGENTVYALVNVPYNEFYQAAGLENSDGIDAVSSATTGKAANCKNVYFAETPTLEGGVDISGVIVPVLMDAQEYQNTIAGITSANEAGYISGAVTDPAVYLKKGNDGEYQLVDTTKGTEEEGVKAELLSASTWGDYQLNLSDTGKGKAPANVYGVYITMDSGEKYAMLQSQNLWTPGNYYEAAWSTVSETNRVGCLTNCGYYKPMEGQKIESMAYITTEGVVTYRFETAMEVQAHFDGTVTAVQIEADKILVSGVPDDAKDVKVTVQASGRGGAVLAEAVDLAADGVVGLTGDLEAEKTYNVTVASSNYAAAKTTLVLLDTEEKVYALVNVPYSEFYQAAGLSNADGIDAVSSATTGKAANCKNVYFAAQPTIEGGTDISGVVIPVQMGAAQYQEELAKGLNANEAGYVSGAVEDPELYLTKGGDGNYTLVDTTGGAKESGVAAELTSESTWGDYQLNLSDSGKGKAPADVYGVYMTTESGAKYAMLQSQNLWTPGNYYEAAWSTVSEENRLGCLTNCGYYQPMEGQKIISMTWITAKGVTVYEFADALEVQAHFEGEIKAIQTAMDQVLVTGFPDDAEDVRITVQASGRGGAVLADGVVPVNGVVTLTDPLTEGTTYNVTVASGNYAAAKTSLVGGEAPEGLWVLKIPDQVYTGKAIKPEPRVFDGATELRKGKDYTLSYKNNTNAADSQDRKAPTVVVKGKGNYSGSAAQVFTILQKDIEDSDVVKTFTDAYAKNGSNPKLVFSAKYNGKALKKAKDYTLAVEDSGGKETETYAEGTYTLVVKGTGNYTGEADLTFEVGTKTPVSKLKVKISPVAYEEGKAAEPAVEVKDGKTALEKDKDFTLSYQNNMEAGTAAVTITGIGDYFGSRTESFTITGRNLSKVKFDGFQQSVDYTGSEIIQNAVLTYDGKELTEKDYTVSYSNNVEVGRATAIYTGKGAYTGTVKKTFKIKAYDIGQDDGKEGSRLHLAGNATDIGSFAYEKGGTKPSIELYDGTRLLTEGEDYTLSYQGNTAVSTAKTPTITIKGKGNYKGTCSLKPTFTITPKDLSDVAVTAQDVELGAKAGKYKSVPVLTDTNGKVLKAGTDYSKDCVYVYKDSTEVTNNGVKVTREAGSAVDEKDMIPKNTVVCVTVSAAGGNYTGSVTAEYRIVSASISKAKITVTNPAYGKNQFDYTGEEVQISKNCLSVKVDGTELKPTDYEILENTYQNNVSRGTASVQIRGKGKYGGTATVKFKIGKVSLRWFLEK